MDRALVKLAMRVRGGATENGMKEETGKGYHARRGSVGGWEMGDRVLGWRRGLWMGLRVVGG